jgi:hypothetical protein
MATSGALATATTNLVAIGNVFNNNNNNNNKMMTDPPDMDQFDFFDNAPLRASISCAVAIGLCALTCLCLLSMALIANCCQLRTRQRARAAAVAQVLEAHQNQLQQNNNM